MSFGFASSHLSYRPDYKSTLALYFISQATYTLLTPAFDASAVIILVNAQIEPFLLTVTSSATFGDRLSGLVSRLSFEDFASYADPQDSERDLLVAKRVFQQLTGDSPDTSPQCAISTGTAQYDLTWNDPGNLHIACFSRRHLASLSTHVSPIVSAHFPLPASWKRLSRLHFRTSAPAPSALSIFDHFPECPRVPSLRSLSVHIRTASDKSMISRAPVAPLQMSTAEELELYDHLGPQSSIKLLLDLIDSCQPSRLILRCGYRFMDAFATRLPTAIRTLVLAMPNAWNTLVQLSKTSPFLGSSIERLDSICSPAMSLDETECPTALPSALKHFHIFYVTKRPRVDWASHAVQVRMRLDSDLQMSFKREITSLRHSVETALDMLSVPKVTGHLESICIEPEVSDSDSFSGQIRLTHLQVTTTTDDVSPLPLLNKYVWGFVDRMMSMLARICEIAADNFTTVTVPPSSIAALMVVSRSTLSSC